MAAPLTIKLIRHGESEANAGRVSALDIGDHQIPLSPRGREQARAAGALLGPAFLEGALVYCSPYRRTRETLEEALQSGGLSAETLARVRRYEDPRLREVEHGYADADAQQDLRRTHGWFYYRYQGGESPADCFDRTSGFLESMLRQVERRRSERALIVAHGLTIRCFVMRFLHLTVEQFDAMLNPGNAEIVTLGESGAFEGPPVFSSGRWGVAGLRLRAAPR